MGITVTLSQIAKQAAEDVIQAYNESGSAETPDGGWDAWLINGIGIDATCRMFGENPDDNQDGWSDSMSQKLTAYNKAAVKAMRRLEP